MTLSEFNLEFDLLYDNAEKDAPGLDKYEKSVYLTMAQEELVKSAYSGYNQIREGVEGNEKQRRWLNDLVKDFKSSSELSFLDLPNITLESQFFPLPSDLMYILWEEAKFNVPTDSSLNDKFVPVIPITHDEYHTQKKNPFRKPNTRKVWRIDLRRGASGQMSELVSDYEISQYRVRYLKQPDPIVLVDFEEDSDLAGQGLTVNGENTATDCSLNPETHRDILNRAVELAIRDYQNLQLADRIKMNDRVN